MILTGHTLKINIPNNTFQVPLVIINNYLKAGMNEKKGLYNRNPRLTCKVWWF